MKAKSKKAKKTVVTSSVSQKDITSFASVAFEDVWFSATGDEYKRFGDRMNEAATSDDESVKAFLSKISSKHGAKEFNAIVRSPGGLRALLDIENRVELKAYCKLLNISQCELNSFLSNTETPPTDFSNVAFVAAIGVWSQSIREEVMEGASLDQETVKTAETAFSALGELESFKIGRNLAKRIWNNIVLERKRGRRADNYMEQYFESETKSA